MAEKARCAQMKHKRERQLKGINRVRKRLADGTVETYYYHRASGTRLPSPYGGAEFLGVYLEAEKGRAASAENLDAIIGEYLRSPKFARKAARTQKEYRRLTGIVAQEFGSMPLKALESPKARGAFIDYQEQMVVSRMLWKFPGGVLRAYEGASDQAARSRAIGTMG
jgi:hypothetical protein